MVQLVCTRRCARAHAIPMPLSREVHQSDGDETELFRPSLVAAGMP